MAGYIRPSSLILSQLRGVHWSRLKGKAKYLKYKDKLARKMDSRSKRQRLKDLVKTTRDVYIPSLSNTITQLASEATTRALGTQQEGGSTANQPNSNIKGAHVVIYPHFTRRSGDGVYYTQAHGWVYSTEGSVRKKKIILALAKQLTKSNNQAVSDMAATQLDEQLSSFNDPSDSASTISASSELTHNSAGSIRRADTSSSQGSTSSNGSDVDDVVKERVAAFVNKSVGNAELIIAVSGSEEGQLTIVELLTDTNGNFNTDVITPYKPTAIHVSLALDESIMNVRDTIFAGDSPYCVISDIDDTIKRTGVCGDKRAVFRNIFAENIESWEIPGAADCYRYLQQRLDVSFFYVSNSPYQLFGNLSRFFEMFEFPLGSMYLKKYTGNYLNSLMEQSHARKKAPLERILHHYKDRKFFLIGDTSEQDLEAYVDIAREHPDNISAIYLRVAEGSMTTATFKTLNDIINKRSTPLNETPGDMKEKLDQLRTSEQNLIDLDDDEAPKITKQEMEHLVQISEEIAEEKEELEEGTTDDFFANQTPRPHSETHHKKPPQVPKKPNYLKSTHVGDQLDQSEASSSPKPVSSAPPLPRRPIPTPPPKAKVGSTPTPSFSSNGTLFETEESVEWIERILTSLIVINKANPNIRLKLFNEFADIQDEMSTIVKNKL